MSVQQFRVLDVGGKESWFHALLMVFAEGLYALALESCVMKLGHILKTVKR